MPETRRPFETFRRYRSRLFGIAYRMLGSVQDAEDVLQEAYLRWHQTDADARSWLSEPIAIGDLASAGHRAELASDLSMALLVLLERSEAANRQLVPGSG